MNGRSGKCYVYIGTYSKSVNNGICIFEMDKLTGFLTAAGTAAGVENPSYLAFSNDNSFLYAVSETNEFSGNAGGGVAAYAVCKETGSLDLINVQPTKSKGPCHLAADRENKYVITANYGEGTLSVFPLNKDGSIAPLARTLILCGPKNTAGGRQDKAHTHYVGFTPDERFLFAVDLGIDQVVLYDYDKKNEVLADAVGTIRVKPGSGPRHIAFHPDGIYAYLINELSSDIVVFSYDHCSFHHLQSISALPKDFHGESYGGAIHISPDGRYLYATNRGYDSIAVFRIEKKTGLLELIANAPSFGKFPRDFCIDPTGRFMYVANQNSDIITLFRINMELGIPVPLYYKINIPSPACVKIVELSPVDD